MTKASNVRWKETFNHTLPSSACLRFLSISIFVDFFQVQEAMQPMQQVMSEAESILATEPKVGFNIGQAKEELIKVNVCIREHFAR